MSTEEQKKELEDIRHEIEKAKLQLELEQLKMKLPIHVNLK
jgi:hypothetical protein